MKKEIKLIVTDEVGLHVRTASIFASEANKYKSDIIVKHGEKIVNGKSMLNVMSLGVKKNGEILVSADGTDADKALNKLKKLVESNFKYS